MELSNYWLIQDLSLVINSVQFESFELKDLWLNHRQVICKFYCDIIEFLQIYTMEWQKHCCQCLTNKSLHSSIAIYVLWSNYQQWWRTTSNLGFCSAWVTLSDYLSAAAATVCPWVKSCLKLHLPYARQYNPRFVYFLPTFWSSLMYCDLWLVAWVWYTYNT